MKPQGITIAAAVAAAALFVGCGGGAGALKMLPEDTAIVVGFDLTKARGTAVWDGATELYDKLAKGDMEDAAEEMEEKLDDFVKAAGVNPVEDLKSVVIGIASPGEDDDYAAIVSFGAAVEIDGMLDYMEDEYDMEFEDDEVGGVTIYSMGDEVAFGFLDDKTMVAGTVDWVEEAAEIKGGKGKSAAENKELAAAVKKVPSGAAAWAAAAVNDDLEEGLGETPIKGLDDAKYMVGALNLSSGAEVTVLFGFEKEDEAADVVDALEDAAKDGKKMAKGMKDDIPFAKDLVEAYTIEAKGSEATFTLTIEEGTLDDIFDYLEDEGMGVMGMFMGGMGGGGGGGSGKSKVNRPLVGGTGEGGADSLYDIADNIRDSSVLTAGSDSAFRSAVEDTLLDLADGVSSVTGGKDHDVVLVVDTTGTMGGPIDALQEMRGIFSEFMDAGGRIALIDYKDDGDDFTSKVVTELTDDPGELMKGISRLEAMGGGDLPEAAYEGMADAADLSWKAKGKTVILISDADAHSREPARSDAYDWFEKSGAGLAIVKCSYF